MTKKPLFLVVLLLVLAGVYIVFFTDWFKGKSIQIVYTLRPPLTGRRVNPAAKAVSTEVLPVIFGFDRKVQLTMVKVVPVAELETNKYPQAVWHLVTDSNTPPVKSLVYGMPQRGMRPANKGQVPQPLVPGVKYRLFIEAGDLKGQEDFKTKPVTP
jgi:hypothetical protein